MEIQGQSDPPRGYRHFTWDGPGWTYSDNGGGPFPHAAFNWVYSATTSHYGFNAISGALENTSDTDTNIAYHTGPVDYALVPGGSSLAEALNGPAYAWNDGDEYLIPPGFSYGTGFNPFIHIHSKTNLTMDMAAYTQSISGSVISVTAGYFELNLIDEDLDDDAEARGLAADPYGEHGGVSYPDSSGALDYSIAAIKENRSTAGGNNGLNFLVVKTKYALLLTNLINDLSYKWTIKIARRTAANAADGSDANYGSTWTIISTLSDTFTADDIQKVIGGTWTDADSDEVMDNDEITPGTDLACDKGYEYAIVEAYLEWSHS